MTVKVLTLTLVFLALNLPAQAEPLQVKPGLWESTTTTEKKSSRQPGNLDRLTPEQRAKVEKKLAERIKKETRTVQSCLREEQVTRGETFLGNTHQDSCTRTFLTQTASDLLATIACTGSNRMTGRIALHAADAEHMSGSVEMTYGAVDTMQMLTRSDISARWLGADCSESRLTGAHRH